MNCILLYIERVNDAVIADAQAKTLRAFESLVWNASKPRSDLVDFCFNSLA